MPDRGMQRPVPPPGGWVLFWMLTVLVLYLLLFGGAWLVWSGLP